jgi:hypothetical protein
MHALRVDDVLAGCKKTKTKRCHEVGVGAGTMPTLPMVSRKNKTATHVVASNHSTVKVYFLNVEIRKTKRYEIGRA